MTGKGPLEEFHQNEIYADSVFMLLVAINRKLGSYCLLHDMAAQVC